MIFGWRSYLLLDWTCPDCGEPTVYAERLNPVDGEPEGELWCETCCWCAYGTVDEGQ